MKRHFTYSILLLFLSVLTLSAQGWEWQNPLPHGHSVNDIVMFDASSGVAACNNGYYLYTANAGRHWSTRRLGILNIERVLVAGDGSLIAVTDHRRIYRSTDRSWSWQQVYQGMDNAGGQRSDIVRAGEHTLVGFLNGAHIVVSYDDGQTWQQLTNIQFLSESIRSISSQSPTTWYIVTSRNVIRTTDSGKNWNYVNQMYESRGLQRFVFPDSLSGYQLRDGQLLQTSDGGASWKEMDIFGFGLITGVEAGDHLGSNVYCLSLGRFLVNKSSDGGETWNISLTESAFPDADPVCMTFIDPSLGFIGGDGGRILRTNDGGQSWSIVHGLGYIGTINNLKFRDADFGIATTYSSTILLTSNGGSRWNEAIPAAELSMRELALSPDGSIYLIGVDNDNSFAVLHSTNDGVSWEHRGMLPLDYQVTQPEMPQSLYALPNDELYVGATYGILLHSTDGGATWDRKSIGHPAQNPFSTGTELFFFPPSTIIYVRSNALEVSSDGGQTWESRRTTSNRTLLRTQFLSPEVGYALLPSEFAKTTDGGNSWTIRTGFNPHMLHFFNENDGVAVWNNTAQDGKAYLMRTNDGGETWQQYSVNERVEWNNWFWLTPQTGWVYGYGGVIRRTDNGGIASSGALASLPETLALLPGYPNPFTRGANASFTIPISLSNPVAVEITVYDMLGRTLTSTLQEQLSSGIHHISLTMDALQTQPPGMYLYRVRAGDVQRTGKLILR
ncbi:MAG: hypothetical protein C0600_00925 [Ignavibacteria bacterium]|nr:MAG: hypothetical protein C0600_00925 [Ignavibacteria bacterium]